MEKYGLQELLEIVTQGAHLVEFDLHVTGDDHLVARHDPVVSADGVPTWLADSRLVDVLPSLRDDGASTVEDVVRAARQAGLGLYADVKSLTVAAAERLVLLLDSEKMIDRIILASARSDIVARCRWRDFGHPLGGPIHLHAGGPRSAC